MNTTFPKMVIVIGSAFALGGVVAAGAGIDIRSFAIPGVCGEHHR